MNNLDSNTKKMFVLDTNVLLHDPTSLYRFEEHDICIPMFVLEELDGKKNGLTDVARNARQVSRMLDQIIGGCDDLSNGVELHSEAHRTCKGKLFIQTSLVNFELPLGLELGKTDNSILGVVVALQKENDCKSVILVSKDINMRLKAKSINLQAQDYFNDKVLEDTDLLYSGAALLPDDFWDTHSENLKSWSTHGRVYYQVEGSLCNTFHVNQYLHDSVGEFNLIVIEQTDTTALLCTLIDYTEKNNVWSISAKNPEQNFVLNLLLNEDIDFVTLLGAAGTGKTLLSLAAGLVQVFDTKVYNEIIVTRATVSVGDDIGFLPGTEEEKMTPWMGAFEDNMEVLTDTSSMSDWGKGASDELIRSKVKIKSMSFMRGRTFMKKYLIIDEAQNLTPKQMKTLITRAGEGTKVVCLGNIAQIDTPYLTEGSSGLTYVVDNFKGWIHGGHCTLMKGERSRLADHANEVL